jgi:hypothetical protein
MLLRQCATRLHLVMTDKEVLYGASITGPGLFVCLFIWGFFLIWKHNFSKICEFPLYHIFSLISIWYHSCDNFFYITLCIPTPHRTKNKVNKNRYGVVNNLPWFVMCIPFSPRLGGRKHSTRWMKIISHHKTWEILYLSNPCSLCKSFPAFQACFKQLTITTKI